MKKKEYMYVYVTENLAEIPAIGIGNIGVYVGFIKKPYSAYKEILLLLRIADMEYSSEGCRFTHIYSGGVCKTEIHSNPPFLRLDDGVGYTMFGILDIEDFRAYGLMQGLSEDPKPILSMMPKIEASVMREIGMRNSLEEEFDYHW